MKDLGQFLICTGLRKQNYFIIDKIGMTRRNIWQKEENYEKI